MAVHGGPDIITDGLVLSLDAADKNSYPGSGTTWTDLSGNGNNFTMDSAAAWNSDGTMTLADAYGYTYSGNITTSSSSTCVFWMYTTDTVSLFWQGNSGGYIGAYRVGNKEYYNSVGSPDFRMDTVAQSNIYDNIRDGNWHMIEFKNCDFSGGTWTGFLFNQYASFQFSNGELASMLIYNRDLTAAESTQNFNAHRTRFGI